MVGTIEIEAWSSLIIWTEKLLLFTWLLFRKSRDLDKIQQPVVYSMNVHVSYSVLHNCGNRYDNLSCCSICLGMRSPANVTQN